MNPSPPGDEELRVAPRAKDLARLRETAASDDAELRPAGTAVERTEPVSRSGVFTFVASVLLIALAFTIGLSYLLNKGWFHKAWAQAEAKAGIVGTATEKDLSSSAPLTPEMFHVTAISLGPNPVAIVNGKPVTQGETASVSTPAGKVFVTVTRIADGSVQLTRGPDQITVGVNKALAQQR